MKNSCEDYLSRDGPREQMNCEEYWN